MEQDEVLEKFAVNTKVSYMNLGFDGSKNQIDVSVILQHNGNSNFISAMGTPYAENSVNFSQSVIVDVYTNSTEFTIVFLQLYMENDEYFCKTIIENIYNCVKCLCNVSMGL